MALAVSTGPVILFMAQALRDGSVDGDAIKCGRKVINCTKSKPAKPKDAAMDHSKMDHGSMGAMDHSKMGAMDHSDNGQMDGMESMDGGATTTSRTPIPVLTDADRAAAFPDLPGHGVHDKKINSFILLDKFEYQDADNGSALAWDAKGWIGGDVDRLWLRSEGERTNGVTENARTSGSVGTRHRSMVGCRHGRSARLQTRVASNMGSARYSGHGPL